MLSPTVSLNIGEIMNVPALSVGQYDEDVCHQLIDIFRADWDSRETSWDFARPPYLRGGHSLLQDAFDDWYRRSCESADEAQRLETENNCYWADVYGLADEVEVDVPLSRVSLTYNPRFAFAPTRNTAGCTISAARASSSPGLSASRWAATASTCPASCWPIRPRPLMTSAPVSPTRASSPTTTASSPSPAVLLTTTPRAA